MKVATSLAKNILAPLAIISKIEEMIDIVKFIQALEDSNFFNWKELLKQLKMKQKNKNEDF